MGLAFRLDGGLPVSDGKPCAYAVARRMAVQERRLPIDVHARRWRRHIGATNMGKYFLAWLLGVPGVILLLIYLFMR
jgi:hypothetical protein